MQSLGYGLNKAKVAGVPFRGLLDQHLIGFPVPASGLIPDKLTNFPAQLVEQPCTKLDNRSDAKLTIDETYAGTISEYTVKYDYYDDSAGTYGTDLTTITKSGTNDKTMEFTGLDDGDKIFNLRIYNASAVLVELFPFCGNGATVYGAYSNTDGTLGGVLNTDFSNSDQDVYSGIHEIGFNKYLKCTGNGIKSIMSDWVNGKLEFTFYKGSGTYENFDYISDEYYLNNGYRLQILANGLCRLMKATAGSISTLVTSGETIADNSFYTIKFERTALWVTTIDITGGSFGSGWTRLLTNSDSSYQISEAILFSVYADVYVLAINQTDLDGNVRWLSDDINDWHVVSGTFENHLVLADLSAPTKDVLGNPLHYLPKGILGLGAIEFKPTDGENKTINGTFDNDVTDWSGSYASLAWNADGYCEVTQNSGGAQIFTIQQTNILTIGNTYGIHFRAKSSATTSPPKITTSFFDDINLITQPDLSASWQNYYFQGTSKSTALYIYLVTNAVADGTQVDIDDIYVVDITDSELEVYNRYNIDGVSQLWKEEIQLIESFNPTYPWRHDLDELTNGDYIRVFGTQLLIQRLFLKAHKTDDDWTAISNILNYSEVLDATQRQRVFNYLKDPSKSNQEAWELYQASDVIVAYHFDQRLSLFNENKALCKLCWEAEETISNYDFSAWTGDDPDDWSVSNESAENYITEDANGAHFVYDNDNPTVLKMTSTFSFTPGHTYKVNIVMHSITTGSVCCMPYCGAAQAIHDTAKSVGDNIKVFTANNSGSLTIYRPIEDSDCVIASISVTEVGDTVAKILDVGSGGVDGLTYNNLIQSNLSKQIKRVYGGVDWIDDHHEMNIDSSMNGKYCYIKSLEHGTFVGYFIITDGKIRGSDIYSQNSDSYKVEALSIYDSEQEGLIEMVVLKQSDDKIRKSSDGRIIRLRKY